jgi:hypothetical protein
MKIEGERPETSPVARIGKAYADTDFRFLVGTPRCTINYGLHGPPRARFV